jgi:predicted Zn-dependent protease
MSARSRADATSSRRATWPARSRLSCQAPPPTPAYSQGLLATAIAYYQNGDVELADQALDNADRLDPNDSIIAIVRTAIALDQYRADEAVLSAREAVRRSRARGGDYAGLAVSRQSGSYPVEAYRFINLNEWARYYGDGPTTPSRRRAISTKPWSPAPTS